MNKASKFTLLVLLFLFIKELMKMKMMKEKYGSGHMCRCGQQHWS
jgi:hypothetical protein